MFLVVRGREVDSRLRVTRADVFAYEERAERGCAGNFSDWSVEESRTEQPDSLVSQAVGCTERYRSAR